jgi:hypothetical protein
VLVRIEEEYKEDGEVKRMPPPRAEQWKGEMKEEDELERMKVRKCVARKNAIPNPGTLLTIPKTFDEILRIIRERCEWDPPTKKGVFESHSPSEQVPKNAQVKTLIMNLLQCQHLCSILRLASLRREGGGGGDSELERKRK